MNPATGVVLLVSVLSLSDPEGKLPMALVICDMSISLDGHVTGPDDSRKNPFGDGAGMMHDWMFDAATDDDRAILRELIDSTGGCDGPQVLRQDRRRGRLGRGRAAR